MNLKAVIFDLDDTLYPEKSYCLSGYRAVSKYLSEKGISSEDENFRLLKDLFEEDAKMVFNRFFDSKNLRYDKDDIKELIRVYREHEPEIEFFPDVLPTIEKLKKLGMRLGILSDGYAAAQRQKVKALNCEAYFEKIVLTDEIGKDAWKPSPRGFEIFMSEFSLSGNEMLYIGDNPTKDFFVKKTAGLTTARIIRKNGVYVDAEYLENLHEDYTLESLSDIVEKIK
ncbi:MAG: HAD-IA family hydrolase [Lachnospiraceae bacterium]|nr:HAD-IA family hydrolase [Lachnospiraceae bacterium]